MEELKKESGKDIMKQYFLLKQKENAAITHPKSLNALVQSIHPFKHAYILWKRMIVYLMQASGANKIPKSVHNISKNIEH